jgi:hypothetical protein
LQHDPNLGQNCFLSRHHFSVQLNIALSASFILLVTMPVIELLVDNGEFLTSIWYVISNNIPHRTQLFVLFSVILIILCTSKCGSHFYLSLLLKNKNSVYKVLACCSFLHLKGSRNHPQYTLFDIFKWFPLMLLIKQYSLCK